MKNFVHRWRMSRTFKTSLGSSPLSGRQGIDQATRFKHQLYAIKKKPEGVSLLTVTHPDPPHMEVVALSDADVPCAVEWVAKAQELAPELWALAERRKGVAR
ncbi:MAG: hypothetical protein C0467_27670 [Planctomycetaceae bacterium]|nr:hypothetical protein [Planctomycetaceae bacterium]